MSVYLNAPKQNHLPIDILFNGGVKHPIWQPLKHQSHIMVAPIDYPHKRQQILIRTTAKDGSI